jgi:hypothetical protein
MLDMDGNIVLELGEAQKLVNELKIALLEG